MHPRFSNFLLTTAALIALSAAPAAAGPEGATVVGGGALVLALKDAIGQSRRPI
jgi:hypothetical protein